MKRDTHILFLAVSYKIAVLLLLALPSSAGAQEVGGLLTASPGHFQTEVDSKWQRVSPKGEEFSFSTPVRPTLIIGSKDKYFVYGGQRVSEQRGYSAYVGGFVFALESYKTTHPERLLPEMKEKFKGLQFIEDAELNGFKGKKYQIDSNKIFGYIYYYLTKGHVYILRVATLSLGNPSFVKFLSSFSLGTNADTAGDLQPQRADTSITPIDLQNPGANQEPVFKPKDTTRKAIIIWRPEPTYTETARHNQIMGTVVLKAVFSSSGQVIITEVVKKLEGGLTENAIEAAKSIRFLPSEKDGRLVSMSIQIEYNFNLY